MSELTTLEDIKNVLEDKSQGVEARIRALFAAKHLATEEAVHIVAPVMRDESVLLAHEAAYVLGQMQLECAVPYLIQILEDLTINSMTRHEAAEALAAIGKPDSIESVKKFLNDASPAVRETCYLALRSLEIKASEKAIEFGGSVYKTVDPIAAIKSELSANTPTEQLQEVLIDEKEDLYKRYVALFQLRTRSAADPEAVKAISGALKDKSSALFRHEVAFVLGQIQNNESLKPLIERLEDAKEDSMARHEAAIAIGSVVAANNNTCEAKLAKEKLQFYSQDSNPIVAESCKVALDTIRRECVCSS